MQTKMFLVRLKSLIILLVLFGSCQPTAWDGPRLTPDRAWLSVEDLINGEPCPLLDQSFFARPDWATTARHPFTGTLEIMEGELIYPKKKDHYPGETIFPQLRLDFITHEGTMVPRMKTRISTRAQNASYWDVIVGVGVTWQEAGDGDWDRASFPLTLTDRWIGTARNCVATFVYQPNSISSLCLQCSQETADIDDAGLANLRTVLSTDFQPGSFPDSAQVIRNHQREEERKLPVRPLSDLDTEGQIAGYFDRMLVTRAPTSLGAVLRQDTLYLHPPQTRHGPYPYPAGMRHGVYSVSKSMAGALSLLAIEEHYPDDTLFDLFITDYVPDLADHPGWQGVTFGHTLSMRTGVEGGEDAARLLNTLIVAETRQEAISDIARLPDVAALPGETFNYASTNLFVLACALQHYVRIKSGQPVNYWDLVREQVLAPLGAENFPVLTTMEKDSTPSLPILAYGALPTIDEAAKIARLFANKGAFAGEQLLSRARIEEIFNMTEHPGSGTNNDFRGSHYQHGFWAKEITTPNCTIQATYMLGFGENYVVFLPSGTIIFRFLDEHDLNVDELILAVEGIISSCE
jgi:CubicO group peptidase (beta-lactamase class C family)